MKKTWEHLRSRVLAGVLFLIPLLAVISIVNKLWVKLTGAGDYLVGFFGLKPLLGSQSVAIVTALLLLILFYLFGWLVKYSLLTRTMEWLEKTLLQYIPGYLTYKAQMKEKLKPAADQRVPVFVTMPYGRRPGLMIEEQPSGMVVFFPNSPDSNNGEILLVDKANVSKLGVSIKEFFSSIQQFGKGLV